MVQGINTAAAGMISILNLNDIVANNMANVNTTGFKQLIPAFKNIDEAPVYKKNIDSKIDPSLQVMGNLSVGSELDAKYLDFSQGNLKHTGRNLDVALNSPGFFIVENEFGEFYTRNGNFSINDEGDLVTMSGDKVIGEGGAININVAGMDLKELNITEDGRIMHGEMELARLSVVDFEDKTTMAMMGNNLYRNLNDNAQPVEPEKISVVSGNLESSNSNVIKSMTDSITGARTYETLSQVVRNTDATVKKSVNEVGRVTG